MPVQHTYGTFQGGVYAIIGLAPNFREERGDTRPDWCWQRRSAKTWKDRNAWESLWSYGCRTGGGGEASFPAGELGHGFEPFSCDGEGTQTVRFLRGIAKDSTGVPIDSAVVQVFRTSDDAYMGQSTSVADGSFSFPTKTVAGIQFYFVAYKAGAPDVAGTTVNTLTSTNVDGS